MARRGIRELTRKAGSYGGVSLICFIVNNLLLIGLDSLGQPLWLNLVVSAALMIVGGFVLQAFFTFAAPLSWRAFGRYALMMLPNVPLAYGLLWLLSERLSIPMHYSAPLAMTLLLVWNAAGSAWAFQSRSGRT